MAGRSMQMKNATPCFTTVCGAQNIAVEETIIIMIVVINTYLEALSLK